MGERARGHAGRPFLILAAGLVQVATSVWDTGYPAWFSFKLVIDVVNLKYKHIIFGMNKVDLSMYDLANDIETQPGICEIWVEASQTGAGGAAAYIGYVFLTLDEP